MLYIFDKDENLLSILNDDEYEDYDLKEKTNDISTFNFSTTKNTHIAKYNKVGAFNNKDKFLLFVIDDIKELTDEEGSTLNIECLLDFSILNNNIIEDKRIVNSNLREAAIKALEGTNYNIGIVEEFELRNINFYDVSRLKAINDIINTFKCEIDVRYEIQEDNTINKFIDFKHRVGRETGLRFTYDTGLTSIEKDIVTENHFNVLYGRGKALETDSGGYSRKLKFTEINGGKSFVEDLDSIRKYGRLEGIYTNSNIDDKQELLKLTKEKLETTKELKYTYKTTIENLNELTGYEHYDYEKGDSIIIADEEADLILEARILELNPTEEDIFLTLGNIQTGILDDDIESELSNIKDKVDLTENDKPTIDDIYPDTLPDVPVLESKALYSSVILEWTYSNKDYYTYELFASQVKDFNPTLDNRIFEGKASSYLHEVNPSQTWYYRVRAKNSYGKTTLFSAQVKGITFKISDATEFFEEVAIGHALIRDLDMDKATVGKLKGQFIEAKNLTVTDGNGKQTLYIDSFGRVNLDVKKLSINSNDISNIDDRVVKVEQKIEPSAITQIVSENIGNDNLIANSGAKGGIFPWTHAGMNYFNVADATRDNTASSNKFVFRNPNNHPTETHLYSNRFKLEGNKEYTLSGKCFIEGNKQGIDFYVLVSGDITLNPEIANLKSRNFDYVATEFRTEVKNKWIEFSVSFRTQPGIRSGYVRVDDNGALNEQGRNEFCYFTDLMLSSGIKNGKWRDSTYSISETEQKLTPTSIVNTVNKGLSTGEKISVAGTVLDEKGFSQLNNGKLSVRLNNNGTHIYSFLKDGIINGSIQSLRNTITNDDVMALTHENNAFFSIGFPNKNIAGNYFNYIVFDTNKLLNPVPITFFTDTDFAGYNIWLNKKNANVGSRLFGGTRDDGRGYAALHGTNLQFVDPSSGNFHFNVTREMFDVYSSEVQVRNSLKVYGNKNCIQETKYGDIPFYANEDINSLLTETNVDTIFETTLVDDKYICRIEIDELMQECINTTIPYNVYIDKVTFGDYKVEIRKSDHFILESDRHLKFKYKLEGRRKGFEIESKEVNFMKRMTVKLPKIDNVPDEPEKIVEKSILYKPPIEIAK